MDTITRRNASRRLSFERKKGDTSQIFYFILMIVLFLVIYMILLPTHEKKELLGEPSGGLPPPNQGGNQYGGNTLPQNTPGGGGLGFRNLLSESPGLMRPNLDDIIQRPLASVNLFSLEESAFHQLASQLVLESSAFSDEIQTYTFELDDLQRLNELQLHFFLIENDGELEITLNGVQLFRGELTSDQLPMPLPTSVLQRENVLTLTLHKTGFFQSSRYQLKDLTLVGKIVNQNNHEVRQFTFTRKELASLNHLSLVYALNCRTIQENGRIVIFLNSNAIHDGVTVCDAGVSAIDLNLQEVVEGRNTLEFFLDKGHYVLENVFLEADLSELEYPRYHFVLQVPDIEAIAHGGADVHLDARFFRDGYRKSGTFFVNGFPIYFDEYTDGFTAEISGLVYEGQNVITVVPDTAFEMVALNVVVS